MNNERIADFTKKLKGFADFKNATNRKSASNFVPNSGQRLSRSSDRGSLIKLTLDCGSGMSLVGMFTFSPQPFFGLVFRLILVRLVIVV